MAIQKSQQGSSPTDKLRELKMMLDEELISQEEFEQKKREILERM